MSDWVVLLAIFMVVLNPAATALVIAGHDGGMSSSSLARALLPAAGIVVATLLLAAALSERLLDWLNLSLSTFQIATGVLLVFGALQAFVGPGLRRPSTAERAVLWLNVAVLVWLISPPPLALAIASAASDGRGFTMLAASVAALAVIGPALVVAGWLHARSVVVLTWTSRVLAGLAVVAAIDLIRQGAENV